MDGKINSRDLNNEQEKAAFYNGNAVVTAGAGSGKTRVLANRFTWLLTEKGFKVNEILTLTFTKKAAVEMNNRIYSLISRIAENESGIKGDRAKEALDDFTHARIQTLDSYGSSIVKQCSSRYGISPDFTIDEKRCWDLALEISYPFFISHRHHPAVKKLYSDNQPQTIVSDIFADILFNYCEIDKPADFSDDVKKQFLILRDEWDINRNKLLELLDDTNNHITQNPELLPDIIPIIEIFLKNNIDILEPSILQEYFDFLLNLPKDECIEKAQAHQVQKTIINFLCYLDSYNSHNLNLRSGKKHDNPVKDNVLEIRSLFKKFLSLAISCLQSGFIISIMSLLSELQSQYLTKKRAEGVLTFRDVAVLSRTILIEQKDIRQSEKEEFKAIMIDEFQDNNELQKDILFLISEKPDICGNGVPDASGLCDDKLFFVGDEKQSIYFFRGADVTVFRKLKDEIKCENLPLKINYRSSPSLIGAFNAIFGGSKFDPKGKNALHNLYSVFAPPDNLPIYEAGYTPLEAGCGNDGKMSVCILNKKTEAKEDEIQLSEYENEARFAAEKINELLKGKTGNGYNPGEIAILLRDSKYQHFYEKHLRFLNIPYTCERINNLFFAGPVNDILSVLRLASNPMDKTAYTEMLRSPFAGLSLPVAVKCMSFFFDNEKKQISFDTLPVNFLNNKDKTRYENAMKIYTSIKSDIDKKSISGLVSDLWHKWGYRYETEWHPHTRAYREMYDYLFCLAVKADDENQGLASFTDSMIALRAKGGQFISDMALPLERPSAVHLMTIHKSKGLEFPVVFLCCCGKKSRNEGCDIVYNSKTAGIVFSPPPPDECRQFVEKRNNYFWEQVSNEIRRKRTAELRRILYVGMTRAKNELYITGFLDMKENKDIKGFPQLLKYDIESKCESKENYIEGDSIIDDDTLFGILLPSLVSHINENINDSESNFFSLEEIPVYTEEYIKRKTKNSEILTNNRKGINTYIKRTKSFYEKAKIIKTPILHDNHVTPVSLKRSEEDSLLKTTSFNSDYSGKASDDIFNRVDSMLDRFLQNSDDSADKFNSGSFGTIAHICVEALLNKKEAEIPANISGLLSPEEMDALFEAGNELARRFVSSPLGKIAESAGLRESEFSFRTLFKNNIGNEVFINGTVDLFFEDNDSIHIVDFKTDNREVPTEHTAQMACYFHAISALFAVPYKKQCRVWLYYLRTGHAVDMTERVDNFNLGQRAFS
ncbi:MAG: UvrD-helicase domain-containing protein [Treponema sp.]|nr:UvrD-helicase domain-containing protein [Treponema sp.]